MRSKSQTPPLLPKCQKINRAATYLFLNFCMLLKTKVLFSPLKSLFQERHWRCSAVPTTRDCLHLSRRVLGFSMRLNQCYGFSNETGFRNDPAGKRLEFFSSFFFRHRVFVKSSKAQSINIVNRKKNKVLFKTWCYRQ